MQVGSTFSLQFALRVSDGSVLAAVRLISVVNPCSYGLNYCEGVCVEVGGGLHDGPVCVHCTF